MWLLFNLKTLCSLLNCLKLDKCILIWDLSALNRVYKEPVVSIPMSSFAADYTDAVNSNQDTRLVPSPWKSHLLWLFSTALLSWESPAKLFSLRCWGVFFFFSFFTDGAAFSLYCNVFHCFNISLKIKVFFFFFTWYLQVDANKATYTASLCIEVIGRLDLLTLHFAF